MADRRGFLIGLSTVLAAPAIVKTENLMKIVSFRGFEKVSREIYSYSVDPISIYDPVLFNIIRRYYVNCIVNDIIGVPSMSEFTSENIKKSLEIKYRYE